MKKLLVFFTGMLLFLQQGQAQFKRHYWLNPNSENYTLSYPASNGEWMLAAARQERGATKKNTIAVFRLDNAYNILDSRIIGLPGGAGEHPFNPNVDFDIHCIVESYNPIGYYIICGTIRRDEATASGTGLVVVTDAGLNPLSIREYPEVSHFYSVYAQDNFYFVCGQTQDRRGIVLRDNITTFIPTATAYVTDDQWDYQKIRVVNSPGSGQIKISGTGYFEDEDGEEFQTLGFSVFFVSGGNLVPRPNAASPPLPPNPFASWQFQPVNNHGINSKVVIANHPGGAGGEGVILSVSDANNIYTYFFFQLPFFSSSFRIPCQGGVLEDMECAGPGGGVQTSQIAWVGNRYNADEQPFQTAYYLHMDLPITPPPFPFTGGTATFTYFHPFPAVDNAYYSLHKLYFHRNLGDLLFHAGGYYQHYDGNKATFVVTPDILYIGDEGDDGDENKCITRQNVTAINLGYPQLLPLELYDKNIQVVQFEVLSKKYLFCEIDCEGEYKPATEECGNKQTGIIIIDNE